jgi:transposase InsO family protein
MNQLYKAVGISKQAAHQYSKRQAIFDDQMVALIAQADILKREHPGCGVEKMYYTLKPDFIGRDRFIETFMQLGYRVKKQKNYKRTTIASKLYYPNLIKGVKVDAPSQIWQSDITYIKIRNRYCYAVFIIDVYTKKVVGWQVSDHMRAEANLKALKMAFKTHRPPRIHHSDRGSQYTCNNYIALLKANGANISMAITAMDNAYAERINQTIKHEYLYYKKIETLTRLRTEVKKAVKQYNSKRPHNHLNRMNPIEFEKHWSLLLQKQRPVITIFNNEN